MELGIDRRHGKGGSSGFDAWPGLRRSVEGRYSDIRCTEVGEEKWEGAGGIRIDIG